MMDYLPGTWLEQKLPDGPYGAHRGGDRLLYVLQYHGWRDTPPNTYDVILLRLEGGLYATHGTDRASAVKRQRLEEDDWRKIKTPPWGERQAMKAVFA